MNLDSQISLKGCTDSKEGDFIYIYNGILLKDLYLYLEFKGMDLIESESRLGGVMAVEFGEVYDPRKQNTSQRGARNSRDLL